MEHKEYRLAAILFTDIVGFSRMMGKDEVATLKLMEFHNGIIRRHVTNYNGNIIKTIGDAFLIEFSNAANAIKTAIEIQNELEVFNATQPPMPLVLRIGCHLGDIYFFENDALGEGINIASRLQALCRPGRICMSQEVYNLVANKVTQTISSLGIATLKNITREVHAFEIVTNGAALADSDNAAVTPVIIKDNTEEPKPEPTPKPKNGELGYDEVRQLVFGAIKKAGHRLTIEDARQVVGITSPSIDAYLEKMLSQGFLVKTARAQNFDQSYKPDYQSNFKEMGNDFSNEIGKTIKGVVNVIANEIAQAEGRYSRPRRPLDAGEYLEKKQRMLAEEEKGFRGHLTSYIGVNAMLWLIYGLTSFGGFPWPLIVNSAWLIGLASHFAGLRQKRREVQQQQALPTLTDSQLLTLRKLFKDRRAWWGHLISNVAVGLCLTTINLITSPGFFWAAIPMGAMSIGLFAHLPSFKQKEAELLEQLSKEGVPIEVLSDKANLPAPGKASGPVTANSSMGAEALRIKARIIRQYKGLKGNHPLGDDFIPVLDNYITQIDQLAIRSQEIDNILITIPVNDLRNELSEVTVRRKNASNERMQTEYDKTIDQINKQLNSHQEMAQEQQVLNQRLINSVNSLKQLEIDLSRMRSISSNSGEGASSEILRSRSEELRHYLEDLRAGYQEAELSSTTLDEEPKEEA